MKIDPILPLTVEFKFDPFRDMREKSETPDDDTSETPRGMIDNRLRF